MIQELGKNHYKLIVCVNKDGKRIARKTRTVHCGKREVNRLYVEFEREVKENADSSNDLLSQMLESYIANCEQNGCSPTTVHKYREVENRIFSFLTDGKASKVNSLDLNNLVAEMANKGYSPKTIRNTFFLLSGAFTRYVQLGLLKENPCVGVNLPKAKRKEPHIVSREDLSQFHLILDDVEPDVKVGLELALYKGLRRSEIMGLKPCDYNPNNRTLWIRRSRHIVKGETVIKSPKNESSNRILSLPSSIADDVENLIELHNSYSFKTDDFLILKGDKAMHPDYLTVLLYRKEEKFGMPKASLHALRHSFATMLLNSREVDIAQISRELGHSNISTTLNIYSHVTGGASASSKQISDTTDRILASMLNSTD